jgi:hypothetical protein
MLVSVHICGGGVFAATPRCFFKRCARLDALFVVAGDGDGGVELVAYFCGLAFSPDVGCVGDLLSLLFLFFAMFD